MSGLDEDQNDTMNSLLGEYKSNNSNNNNDYHNNITDDNENNEDKESGIPNRNDSNYLNWTTDDVVNWCMSSLDIGREDPLCKTIMENEITGDLLPEMSLPDCKELCRYESGDEQQSETVLIKAVNLRLMINKLKGSSTSSSHLNTKSLEQQENMTKVLQNLYSTVSTKLQDYETNYSNLRLEMLEITKNYSANSGVRIERNDNDINDTRTNNFTQQRRNHSNMIERSASSASNRSLITQTITPHNTPPSNMTSPSNQTSSAIPQAFPTRSPTIQSSTSHVNEPLKQLRASKEDSCERILKNAMKRHNLNDQDWRQYVLVIGYGDQERMLDLNEKPVVIFKNLKQQGLHPTIMLRRRADFEEMGVSDTNANNNITPGGRL